MNKKNFFLFLIFCANVLFAQIAIDTIGVDKQAIIDIASNNKAVLFPRIDSIASETDISFLKEKTKDKVPVGLLIYNKAKSSSSFLDKGYYYWNNEKWNLLIDDESVYSRFTIDKVNNTQTQSVVYIKDFFEKDDAILPSNFNDEVIKIGGLTWVELDGLDYSFEIKNNNHNNVFVKVSGKAQYAPSNYENLILGMNLGVFIQHVDGNNQEFKLQGISATNLDNIRNSDCYLFNYSIQTAIGKLLPGKYRIKTYVSGNKNYNNEDNITDKWITLGGKSTTDVNSSNADCKNSSNEELIGRQTVVISESEN